MPEMGILCWDIFFFKVMVWGMGDGPIESSVVRRGGRVGLGFVGYLGWGCGLKGFVC